MVLPPTSSSVQTFALCNIVLFTKFFVTARLQGEAAYNVGARPPEDAGFGPLLGRVRIPQHFGLGAKKADDTAANNERQRKSLERAQRWDRIILNDLETLPFAFAIFGSALLLECDEPLQVVSMVVFTSSRFVFTYYYAKAMQPHRTVVYLVGAFSIMASIGGILSKVISLHA